MTGACLGGWETGAGCGATLGGEATGLGGSGFAGSTLGGCLGALESKSVSLLYFTNWKLWLQFSLELV